MKRATKKPASRREPFAHAADLAGGYRELSALVREWSKHSPWPIYLDDRLDEPAALRISREVQTLSSYVLLRSAAEMEVAAARLRHAGRRIHAAIHGPRDTARYVAQTRREARGIFRYPTGKPSRAA